MNANTTKTILGSLLPFMTNPATIALVGAGALAFTVYSLFSDDDENTDNGAETVPDRSGQLPGPLTALAGPVALTVAEPLETVQATAAGTAETTVQEPLPTVVEEALHGAPETGSAPTSEDEKKEMIRQAMSELGKRSAASRARKKQA